MEGCIHCSLARSMPNLCDFVSMGVIRDVRKHNMCLMVRCFNLDLRGGEKLGGILNLKRKVLFCYMYIRMYRTLNLLLNVELKYSNNAF
jgi:hypothetical protein